MLRVGTNSVGSEAWRDVGEGTSVGTGISDGEEGTVADLFPADGADAGMPMSASARGTNAGDVGDGISVGTGSSVGDR